eukprot:TRINITY_DN41877_c0_g1_i1.p1 TRINITY_DN41877_c0_g1~~TRINITY_DN41877_c0_g1_i1.p1  ORF type:complete len:1613 (-),score=324.43 TRINITY_DN41877_c0_g1_i1:71-4909(-)
MGPVGEEHVPFTRANAVGGTCHMVGSCKHSLHGGNSRRRCAPGSRSCLPRAAQPRKPVLGGPGRTPRDPPRKPSLGALLGRVFCSGGCACVGSKNQVKPMRGSSKGTGDGFVSVFPDSSPRSMFRDSSSSSMSPSGTECVISAIGACEDRRPLVAAAEESIAVAQITCAPSPLLAELLIADGEHSAGSPADALHSGGPSPDPLNATWSSDTSWCSSGSFVSSMVDCSAENAASRRRRAAATALGGRIASVGTVAAAAAAVAEARRPAEIPRLALPGFGSEIVGPCSFLPHDTSEIAGGSSALLEESSCTLAEEGLQDPSPLRPSAAAARRGESHGRGKPPGPAPPPPSARRERRDAASVDGCPRDGVPAWDGPLPPPGWRAERVVNWQPIRERERWEGSVWQKVYSGSGDRAFTPLPDEWTRAFMRPLGDDEPTAIKACPSARRTRSEAANSRASSAVTTRRLSGKAAFQADLRHAQLARSGYDSMAQLRWIIGHEPRDPGLGQVNRETETEADAVEGLCLHGEGSARQAAGLPEEALDALLGLLQAAEGSETEVMAKAVGPLPRSELLLRQLLRSGRPLETLQSQVSAALSMARFHIEAEALEKQLRFGVAAAQAIIDSKTLPVLLDGVLHLGNYVNASSRHLGGARGVTLDSLARLAHTKCLPSHGVGASVAVCNVASAVTAEPKTATGAAVPATPRVAATPRRSGPTPRVVGAAAGGNALRLLVRQLRESHGPSFLQTLVADLESCRFGRDLDPRCLAASVRDIKAEVHKIQQLSASPPSHWQSPAGLAPARLQHFLEAAWPRALKLVEFLKDLEVAEDALRRHFAEPQSSRLPMMFGSLGDLSAGLREAVSGVANCHTRSTEARQGKVESGTRDRTSSAAAAFPAAAAAAAAGVAATAARRKAAVEEEEVAKEVSFRSIGFVSKSGTIACRTAPACCGDSGDAAAAKETCTRAEEAAVAALVATTAADAANVVEAKTGADFDAFAGPGGAVDVEMAAARSQQQELVSRPLEAAATISDGHAPSAGEAAQAAPSCTSAAPVAAGSASSPQRVQESARRDVGEVLAAGTKRSRRSRRRKMRPRPVSAPGAPERCHRAERRRVAVAKRVARRPQSAPPTARLLYPLPRALDTTLLTMNIVDSGRASERVAAVASATKPLETAAVAGKKATSTAVNTTTLQAPAMAAASGGVTVNVAAAETVSAVLETMPVEAMTSETSNLDADQSVVEEPRKPTEVESASAISPNRRSRRRQAAVGRRASSAPGAPERCHRVEKRRAAIARRAERRRKSAPPVFGRRRGARRADSLKVCAPASGPIGGAAPSAATAAPLALSVPICVTAPNADAVSADNALGSPGRRSRQRRSRAKPASVETVQVKSSAAEAASATAAGVPAAASTAAAPPIMVAAPTQAVVPALSLETAPAAVFRMDLGEDSDTSVVTTAAARESSLTRGYEALSAASSHGVRSRRGSRVTAAGSPEEMTEATVAAAVFHMDFGEAPDVESSASLRESSLSRCYEALGAKPVVEQPLASAVGTRLVVEQPPPANAKRNSRQRRGSRDCVEQPGAVLAKAGGLIAGRPKLEPKVVALPTAFGASHIAVALPAAFDTAVVAA